MAAMTVRNLDPAVKQALRERAAAQGNSMEEEIRRILTAVLLADEGPDGALYPADEPRPKRFVPKQELIDTYPKGLRIDYKRFREDIDRYVDDSID